MATRKPDRNYPEVSEDAYTDREEVSRSDGDIQTGTEKKAEGQKKEVDGNVTPHEAVEGRIIEDCTANEVTAANNKTSAERNVEGQTGQNVSEPPCTEQSAVEKPNTFPQRMLLCSRCQAALRHKNIVRRISTTENWTGTCSICKHLLYVGEYEVMDKTIGRTTRHESDTEISGPNHQR